MFILISLDLENNYELRKCLFKRSLSNLDLKTFIVIYLDFEKLTLLTVFCHLIHQTIKQIVVTFIYNEHHHYSQP